MSDWPRYEITGPFQSRKVLVEGREVPFLKAFLGNGDDGIIHLLLDDRYGLDVPVADAGVFIPWIADAIAVALGYTCHPREGTEPVRANPFPPCHMITSVTTDTDVLAALDPDKKAGEGE